MKRILFALTVTIAALCALGVTLENAEPGPDQRPWMPLRTVTASDTALTTSTNIWSNVKALFIPVPRGWTWIQVAAYAYGDGDGSGDPAAGTCSYKLYAVRAFGSAQLVATGTMAVGTLRLSHIPTGAHATISSATDYAWIEGPPAATDYWPTGVTAEGTANDIGTLSFATNGCYGFWLEITNLANMTYLYPIYTGGD